MSAGLLEKLMKTSSVKGSSILSESKIFDNKDFIDTGIPIINLAFSGKIDGGLTNGITVVAAPSKHFKSLLALYCLKAFLNKHKDGVAILYDSEYGITPEYLAMYDIDPSRVLHVPVDNIEQLKFDCVKKLESIDGKKEKVFILIDSLGNMASKKEVDDAENENSVADMTRAKAIRSLFRIITPHIAKKNIPLFVVNATYACMDGATEIMTSNGPKLISEVKKGDFVETDDGFHEVTADWGPADLPGAGKKFVEIEFEDGTKVKCTDDHKFLKNGEWFEARELKIGDDL